MIITPRWSKDRLLVLVGEQHVTAVRTQQDWRGRWCAEQVTTMPMDGELSLAALAAGLHKAVDGWHLSRSVGVHWFLPPDMLAVTLVGKSAGNESGELLLPYAQGQTLSMLTASLPGGNTWLWIHQAWVELLQQASESIHGHTLYLHPRAAFFEHVLSQQAPPHATDASLRVIPDGRYAHIFAGETCVRSYTRFEDAVPADGLPGAREQSELTAASMVLGLSMSSDQHPMDVKLDLVRAESLRPVSGATLHRTGILCHSLAATAERRIRNLVLGLSLAVIVGAGVMFQHQQETSQLNAEIRKDLRELVPQASTARELKAELSRQNNFLALAGKLNEAPNLFQTLGLVIEKTPADTTLTGIDITDAKLSVSAYVQNAKKAKAELAIGDSVFKVLTAQPALDEVSKTGGVHRTYASSVAGGQP